MLRRPLRVAVGVVVGVMVLVGCTTRSGSHTASSAANASASLTAGDTSATSGGSGAATGTPTSSADSSTGTSASAPTAASGISSAPGVGPAPCRSPIVTVDVLDEGSAAQVQYAGIEVTNGSSAACNLTGFPAVVLLANGSPVGAAAGHSGDSGSALVLAPGAKALAKISVASSCNAVLANAARITLPNTSTYVDASVTLRACPSQVTAFSAAS